MDVDGAVNCSIVTIIFDSYIESSILSPHAAALNCTCSMQLFFILNYFLLADFSLHESMLICYNVRCFFFRSTTQT